jgi:NADP-dependent 3-hydroxy acid dehydrogenase YdfG
MTLRRVALVTGAAAGIGKAMSVNGDRVMQ